MHTLEELIFKTGIFHVKLICSSDLIFAIKEEKEHNQLHYIILVLLLCTLYAEEILLKDFQKGTLKMEFIKILK
jgi:hypothetical protein